MEKNKTTIDAGWLYPIYVDEVLPGDSMNLKATMFGRLATPITPVMDNLYLDSFWFFVPNRLIWTTGKNSWAHKTTPATVSPTSSPPSHRQREDSGPQHLRLYGLTHCRPGRSGRDVTVNSLPLRAYALIYNEWFRDEKPTKQHTLSNRRWTRRRNHRLRPRQTRKKKRLLHERPSMATKRPERIPSARNQRTRSRSRKQSHRLPKRRTKTSD